MAAERLSKGRGGKGKQQKDSQLKKLTGTCLQGKKSTRVGMLQHGYNVLKKFPKSKAFKRKFQGSKKVTWGVIG